MSQISYRNMEEPKPQQQGFCEFILYHVKIVFNIHTGYFKRFTDL